MKTFRTRARLLRDLISKPLIEASRCTPRISKGYTSQCMVRSEDGFHQVRTASRLLPSSYTFLVSLNRRGEVESMLLKGTVGSHAHGKNVVPYDRSSKCDAGASIVPPVRFGAGRSPAREGSIP